ncbi:MAG TPA: glycoside hydrolase domain-containing protein, partial [Armatimonadota bacterium]|nr:glycoside hydrolase domain-containing protein [Armatimonadota bacterium]
MQAWLAHSLTRYYPASPAEVRPTLELDMARGERCSLQAVLRTDQAALTVTVTVNAPAPLAVRVRRVGYVPMPHFNTETPLTELEGVGYLPGLVPDPLFPESQAQVGPYETQAFWLTITPPREAAPGRYPLTVTLTPTTGDPITLTATVIVHPTVLPERQDFPVTHWFYADALHDWYQCELFDDRFWSILGRYLENLVAHGQDTLYVPIFTPPLDGVKRPTQLLNVHRTGERYQFDWTLVRRWIAVARAHGIRYFEWTHLFTQWGAAHAIRIYAGHGEDETLLWPADTGAVSATYRTFLAQLLPELKRFLDEEGLLTNSFFHLSDEPLGEQHLQGYRAARQLLHELAPWMRVMDALSHIDFALQGLTDIPIPVISSTLQFVQAGIPCWTYFAGAPRGRYLNRLPDTPLVKVRMSGWLFYRTQVHGFLY